MLVVSAAILMRGAFEQKYAFLLQTFQGAWTGQGDPAPMPAFAAEFDLPYLCSIFSMVSAGDELVYM
jgi:hypothetical protein